MGWDWLGGLASGIVSGLADTGTALINRQSVLDTNAQNERLQREEWGREDTAVQRRMKDLVAAGLNPVLAAGGQGAPTSLTARMEAPSVPMGIAGRAIQAALTQQQIGRTSAETKIALYNADIAKLNRYRLDYLYGDPSEAALKAEREKILAEAHTAIQNSYVADEFHKQEELETLRKAHDLAIIQKTGVLSGVSGTVGQAVNASQIVEQVINMLQGKFGDGRQSK